MFRFSNLTKLIISPVTNQYRFIQNTIIPKRYTTQHTQREQGKSLFISNGGGETPDDENKSLFVLMMSSLSILLISMIYDEEIYKWRLKQLEDQRQIRKEKWMKEFGEPMSKSVDDKFQEFL